MSRELAVFGLLLVGLGWASQACGGPVADVAPNSPQAQATNVRRTAVAAVQAIIANHPTSTPLPAATAAPSPTCQNAIWWTEARSHVGESRTIQGTVVATRPTPDGLAMLEIELMDVGLHEAHVRVLPSGALNHPSRKIHAHAERGLQGREQVALTTADLEDALVGRDQGSIHLPQASVVRA